MTERKTYEFLKHLVTRRLIGCLQDIKTAFSDPEWLELYRKVVGVLGNVDLSRMERGTENRKIYCGG